MIEERDNVRLNALRNALYHTGRRLAFERWNRLFSFLVILFGATAFADLSRQVPGLTVAAGAAVAIIGALQLVFDFSRLASEHKVLQRDYYAMLGEIEETPAPDADKIAAWRGRLARLAGDEPPVLRARDAKAYNDAIDALGTYPETERLDIPCWHRIAGGVLAFEGYNYRKKSES